MYICIENEAALTSKIYKWMLLYECDLREMYSVKYRLDGDLPCEMDLLCEMDPSL